MDPCLAVVEVCPLSGTKPHPPQRPPPLEIWTYDDAATHEAIKPPALLVGMLLESCEFGGDDMVASVKLLMAVALSLMLTNLDFSISAAMLRVALVTPVALVPRELLSSWLIVPYLLGFNLLE